MYIYYENEIKQYGEYAFDSNESELTVLAITYVEHAFTLVKKGLKENRLHYINHTFSTHYGAKNNDRKLHSDKFKKQKKDTNLRNITYH